MAQGINGSLTRPLQLGPPGIRKQAEPGSMRPGLRAQLEGDDGGGHQDAEQEPEGILPDGGGRED